MRRVTASRTDVARLGGTADLTEDRTRPPMASRESTTLRPSDPESQTNERSRAVGRVVAVLEELSVAVTPLPNHELALRLGVPPASMYRLLQKLASLGYVEYSGAQASYAVGPRLAELGERLADAGGRSPQLRRLMTALRAETGAGVTVWVPTGIHVRIAALLHGSHRGSRSNVAGEIASPFSTPGLAIASQMSRDEVRALAAQCRRRHESFGPRFSTVAEVEKALTTVRSRGYASGYNMLGDGWGILGWPVQVTASPLRIGALCVAAPVGQLRRDEAKIVPCVQKLLAVYTREQANASARPRT
jgi:DNA-binding IclR family transcriptional regulator